MVLLKELDFPPEIKRALDALGQERGRKIISLIMSTKKMDFPDLIKYTNFSSNILKFYLKELMGASLINNYYDKSKDSNKKHLYYELSDFGKDLCKTLRIK